MDASSAGQRLSSSATLRRFFRSKRPGAFVALVLAVSLAHPIPVHAAVATIGLGTADSFAVLAGSGITNTVPTTVNGDIGTFPTPSETGFSTLTQNGTNHAADAVTQQAKIDLTTAYNQAAGSGPVTAVATELGGTTLTPGVYNSPTLAITGTLTLDTLGDPAAVFVFQTSSTFVTATASSVVVRNGGTACNVFWQVGSSATLGTGSNLIGSVLALTSITANTGAQVQGRLLASNGAVTLDTNTITRPTCPPPPTTTTTVASTPTTVASTPTTVASTTAGVIVPNSVAATPETTAPPPASGASAPTTAAGTQSTNGASGSSTSASTANASTTPIASAAAIASTTPIASTTAIAVTTAASVPPTTERAPGSMTPVAKQAPAPAVPVETNSPPTRLALTGSDPRSALLGLLLVASGAFLVFQSSHSRISASKRTGKEPHRSA